MLRVFDQDGQACSAAILAALRHLRAEVEKSPDTYRVLGLCFGQEYWAANEAIAHEIRGLTDAGVVVVGAAGNEGGGFAGVLSPADLPEVLTVGSIARKPSFMQKWEKTLNHEGDPPLRTQQNSDPSQRHEEGMVSAFSSRGPTTAELPFGAGRVKPEVVAVGERVCALEAVKISQRSRKFSQDSYPTSKPSQNTKKGSILSAFDGMDENISSDVLGKPSVRSWTLVNNRSGTSVSASFVAGVVALCMEAFHLEKESQKQDNLFRSYSHQKLPEKPNIAFIKEIFIRTARRLTPPVIKKDQEDKKDTEWFFAERQNFSSNASTSSVYAGDALMRTYSHYLYLLQHSMIAQGAGEIQPARALDFIQYQTKRSSHKINNKTLQNDEKGGRFTQGHHNYHSFEKFSSERPALSGWVVFPPQINAQIHNFNQCGGSKVNANCLYDWPYCEQPLYLGAAPKVFNLTLHIATCSNATLMQRHGNTNEDKNERKDSKAAVDNDTFHSRLNSKSEDLVRRGWRYEIDQVFGYKAVNGTFNELFHPKQAHANSNHVDEKNKPDCYESILLDHSALAYSSLGIPELDIQLHATRELHAFTGTISVMIQAFLSHKDEKAKANTTLKDDNNIFRTQKKQRLSLLSNPYEHVDIYGRIFLDYSCGNEHSKKAQASSISHNITIPFVVSIKIRPPPRLQRLVIDTSHSWLSSSFNYSSFSSAFPKKKRNSTVVGPDKTKEGVTMASPPYHENSKPSVNHPHANLALLYLFLTRELGFYVDFFSIFIPEPSFLSDGPGFKNKSGMDWRNDYLASVGTLLVVHQSLPLLPSVRHLLNTAIRPNALRKGLNVIFITDWMNPSASIRVHPIQSTGEKNKMHPQNDQEATSSIHVGSSDCASICKGVSSAPNTLSNLCFIVNAGKLCGVHRMDKDSFHIFGSPYSSLSSHPNERPRRYSSFRSSHVFSINHWLSELINHDTKSVENKNSSNLYDNQEKLESIPTVIIPQLTEVGARHGLWMIPFTFHQPSRNGGVKMNFKGEEDASLKWRSIGEFFTGVRLHLVEHPITYGKVDGKITKLPQPAVYNLLLCGGYDPWKPSLEQIKVGESPTATNASSSTSSSSQGFVGILSFPSSYSAGQVAMLTDSHCLSASTMKIREFFTKLLQLYVAHHVFFADHHDENFSFFDLKNDMIRRLHLSEGIQSTICVELVKELIHAILEKNWEWFSAGNNPNNTQIRTTSNEKQGEPDLPFCGVAVGMFERTLLNEKLVNKGKQDENDTVHDELNTSRKCDPSPEEQEDNLLYEDFELEEHKLLLNSPPYQMQVGFLVNSMLKQSSFVLPKQQLCEDEAPPLDNDIFRVLKEEPPQKEFSQCVLLNSSTELERTKQDEMQFFQHLGAHYHCNYTSSSVSIAQNPILRSNTDIHKLFSPTVHLERKQIWKKHLKNSVERAGMNAVRIVTDFLMVAVFIFFIEIGLLYAVTQRSILSLNPIIVLIFK
ncbi:unnamed protein product [Phytomonas sp. Hart1]|nr:unnamed protein product [Phytomonas sp. Hart1]|eukprot:CCW66788.1 unnamed protein product [Phytomonas sp. isolate Hart1]